MDERYLVKSSEGCGGSEGADESVFKKSWNGFAHYRSSV